MGVQELKGARIDVTAGLLEKIRVDYGRKSRPVCVDGSVPVHRHGMLKEALCMCMEEVEAQGFEHGMVEESVVFVLKEYMGDDGEQGREVYAQRREYLLFEVHGAKRSVSSLAHVLKMLVMNDLLSRLSRNELPGYYADLSKTLDQAQVKNVPHVKQPPVQVEVRKTEEEIREREQERRERERIQEIQKQKQQEEYEKERQSSKSWILQQAYASSSEEESGIESDSGGSIEDWELWGSQEEKEKKKAEKSRNSLSREDKIVIIAHDMYLAKENAAKAKANNDKAVQKESGAIIGRLRREMKELGIADQDLEGLYPTQTASSEVTPAPCANPQMVCKDSEEELDMNIFEAGFDDGPAVVSKANKLYASIVLNPALRDTLKKTSKKENKAKSQTAPRKHPKAVLQQLAQKEGWNAPRFEKLPNGGERNKNGPQHRFQALVDIKPSKTRKFIRAGMHRVALAPELDGWDTIQQAQDACATKALMDLFADSPEVQWEMFQEPFDALIFEIAEHQDQEPCPSAVRSQERERFVDSILASWNSNDISLKDSDTYIHEHRTEVLQQRIQKSIQEKKHEHLSDKAMAQSEKIFKEYDEWKHSQEGQYWTEKRGQLPVTQIREELLECLKIHDIVLVSGETGSGKTTQVPQIILDGCIESRQGANCSIICTQPRRIAAISVADRVAEERGEAGPGSPGSMVGYSVRFDSATNSTTRLEFCTTGILLRRLSSDPALAKLSHVIVDEVHERSMQSDFLIAMLRDLVETRKNQGFPLKVILMSATMNTQMISNYFNGCPVLNASGRTYPVEHLFLEDVYEECRYVLEADSPASFKSHQAVRETQKHLENTSGSKNKALIKSNWGDQAVDIVLNPHYEEALYGEYSLTTKRNLARVDESKIDMDLVEHVVLHIHETQDSGAILVFVPGMGEIDALTRRLVSQKSLQGHVVVPLHSSISPKDQKKAFKIHPKGVRKIVISTNIAETSVTIEDIVYVVDTGKHKERRYDANRSMSMLVEDSVSVANANQRKGRAGRVRGGICFALYTKDCYQNRMKKYQTPEIMRVPLEEMILQIHHLKLSETADAFLSKILQPPLKKAVEGSIHNLVQAGALTKQEELTPMGSHLAQLPVDVSIGKILIMGALLQCLSPCLSIAACLSHKSPFISYQDKEDMKSLYAPFLSKEKKTLASEQQSDHLVLAAALQGWIDAKSVGGKSQAIKYAKKYQLSVQNVDIIMDMREQFASMLQSVGLVQQGTTSSSSSLRWYDDASCPENRHKSSPNMIKSALVASLYPQIAVIDDVAPGSTPTWHDGSGTVAIHPTSTLADLSSGAFKRPCIVYSEKMKTSKIFLRDCSVASPLSVFLFGGHIHVDHRSGLVLIDDWIRIRVSGRCASILLLIRDKIQSILQARVGQNNKSKSEEESSHAMTLLTELLQQEQEMLSWLHT